MIENGKKVKINYTLTVEGEVIDSSNERGPLEYEHGARQIIPGLENKLTGLKPGDSIHVDVAAEDGYGPFIAEAVLDIPIGDLPADIQAGMVLQGEGQHGHPVRGIVKEVFEDRATIDFNHPLAGKSLHFDVDVLEVF